MMDNNKYYVYGVGYLGMEMEDVGRYEFDGVFDNYDDAKNFADYIWEEWLDADEHVYIYHNGELKELQ